MKIFTIFILFSVSATTIVFANSENKSNNLNYQRFIIIQELYWCKKFCTSPTNYYHDNKVSIYLMKLKCQRCYKHYHLTTTLAPSSMAQTSATTTTATTTTTAATTTTTTTLATTKLIVTFKPVNDSTKPTIQQTTVTSTTQIPPKSLPTTTTARTTTTSTTRIENEIQKHLKRVGDALQYMMNIIIDVEKMKERIIKKKKDLVELEMEAKNSSSASLADIKEEGMALKNSIIKQLKAADNAEEYVSDSKTSAKNNLNSAKVKAAKIGLNISEKVQKLEDNSKENLEKFDNELKTTKDEAMKAFAIYDEIEKLKN